MGGREANSEAEVDVNNQIRGGGGQSGGTVLEAPRSGFPALYCDGRDTSPVI